MDGGNTSGRRGPSGDPSRDIAGQRALDSSAAGSKFLKRRARRILLVSREPAVIRYFRDLFRRYRLWCAPVTNLVAARQLTRNIRFSTALVDVGDPVLHGPILMRELLIAQAGVHRIGYLRMREDIRGSEYYSDQVFRVPSETRALMQAVLGQ